MVAAARFVEEQLRGGADVRPFLRHLAGYTDNGRRVEESDSRNQDVGGFPPSAAAGEHLEPRAPIRSVLLPALYRPAGTDVEKVAPVVSSSHERDPYIGRLIYAWRDPSREGGIPTYPEDIDYSRYLPETV
jgi:hypothetical protein